MIPKSHPRYESLITRDKIVKGVKKGITSTQGLIAQGRGEAFDCLIGGKTTPCALNAEKTAAAMLILAKNPVISVNGNVAALVPEEIILLSEAVKAPIEVNLFHRTEGRVKKIIQHLVSHGAKNMRIKTDALIPGIEHERTKVDSSGIFSADVVLVPLEDGDRCKALVDIGKTVIAIDLNPLSRTAQTANVTIVDNLMRAIPNMTRFADEFGRSDKDELEKLIKGFDNKKNLAEAIDNILKHLTSSK